MIVIIPNIKININRENSQQNKRRTNNSAITSSTTGGATGTSLATTSTAINSNLAITNGELKNKGPNLRIERDRDRE